MGKSLNESGITSDSLIRLLIVILQIRRNHCRIFGFETSWSQMKMMRNKSRGHFAQKPKYTSCQLLFFGQTDLR
jgi:hypothetical protein